ncbi:MAG: type II toxin-antitoxin system Phd/YefM family antitoxin [Peptococcaceae bacterium]|nr:type II toxin-antitoxin system Phd/YefM family antitoxin [Peptococcaceae bacterium]
MSTVRSAIENTVAITQFNKGQAGKIFADVKKSGAKVVMKNNQPECVLLSPEDYIQLLDDLNDAQLLALAAERTRHADPATFVSFDEVKDHLGLEAVDLSEAPEVEFE